MTFGLSMSKRSVCKVSRHGHGDIPDEGETCSGKSLLRYSKLIDPVSSPHRRFT
jgi:hypothetical protein